MTESERPIRFLSLATVSKADRWADRRARCVTWPPAVSDKAYFVNTSLGGYSISTNTINFDDKLILFVDLLNFGMNFITKIQKNADYFCSFIPFSEDQYIGFSAPRG